jgi:NUMOD3 motif
MSNLKTRAELKQSAVRTDYYVYALYRQNGTPFYIGKGCGRRINSHEGEARAGDNMPRHRVIRKMLAAGHEVGKAKLHTGLTEAQAHKIEMAVIKEIGRHPHGPLVNLTDGGDGLSGYKNSPATIAKRAASNRALGGSQWTPEARARASASKIGEVRSEAFKAHLSKLWTGRKNSPEAIEKMRLAAIGRKHTPEACAKMSATRRGRVMSDAQRAAISAAMKGRKKSPEHIAAVAATVRGRKPTEETRAKMRASRLAYVDKTRST